MKFNTFILRLTQNDPGHSIDLNSEFNKRSTAVPTIPWLTILQVQRAGAVFAPTVEGGGTCSRWWRWCDHDSPKKKETVNANPKSSWKYSRQKHEKTVLKTVLKTWKTLKRLNFNPKDIKNIEQNSFNTFYSHFWTTPARPPGLWLIYLYINLAASASWRPNLCSTFDVFVCIHACFLLFWRHEISNCSIPLLRYCFILFHTP